MQDLNAILQVDNQDIFFRLFVCPGISGSAEPALLKICFFDATHSKTNMYNEWEDVHLLLVGVDGEKQNVAYSCS